MAIVVGFAVTGLLFGLGEAWALGGDGSGPLRYVYAAALTGLVAAGLGLAAWMAVLAGARIAPVREAVVRFRRLTDRGAEDRTAVVRAHAWIATGAVALVVYAVAVRWLVRRVWLFEDAELAIGFASGVAIALVIVAVVGVALAAPAAAQLLARIDRRVRLPLPPWAPARYALFVALPVTALVAPFAFGERVLLGARPAAVIWYAVVAVSAPAAVMLLRRLPRAGLVMAAIGGIEIALLGVAIATWDQASAAGDAIDDGVGALLGADLVRAASDVDGDRVSSLLGGADCAPFDRDRSPRQREIPGNQIDEDCDGLDATPARAGAVSPVPRFSGALMPGQVQPYNIVWITIDAVRADHVSALGYDKRTTPMFDALADESILFEQAFAQSTRTFLSVPSSFIGRNPGSMDWRAAKGGQQADESHETLAERLRARGYRTGIVLPGGMLEQYVGLQQGFEDRVSYFLDRRWVSWRERAAPSTTSKAIELVEGWLRAAPGKPFFLAAHYIDPHSPYTPHPEQAFADLELSSDEEIAKMPKARRRTRVDRERYDQEIAYADRHVGFLIEYLRHKPEIWKRTIVIITADHGEEFREHGKRNHGFNCHVETAHVPLLIRIPGRLGQRVTSRVGLIDIAPTLMELIGLDDDPSLEGQSLLVPMLRPEMVDPKRPLFCSAASAGGRGYLQRSVRTDRWMLQRELRTGNTVLYDLAADPREKRNLWNEPPADAPVDRLLDLLSLSATGNLKELY